MEIPTNNHRSLREVVTGETILHTDSRPERPSSTTPEQVLRIMEENTIARYGVEAGRLAFNLCFGEEAARSVFSSRYGEPPQIAAEAS